VDVDRESCMEFFLARISGPTGTGAGARKFDFFLIHGMEEETRSWPGSVGVRALRNPKEKLGEHITRLGGEQAMFVREFGRIETG
jgi:hypothetical protein